MISVLTDPLPCTIRADGQELEVLTDFRDWIRFLLLIGSELDAAEKASMLPLWLTEPRPLTAEIADGLRGFCLARELEPDDPGNDADEEDEEPVLQSRPPVWDWEVDGGFVLADFRRYYGIDLLHVDALHWWEFRALFSALPSDSRSMERIGIRGMDLSKIRDKSQRKYYAERQRRIALPFAVDDDVIGELFANTMVG